MAFGEIPDSFSFDRAPEQNPAVETIATEALNRLMQCETQLDVADVILRAREAALDAEIPYQIIEANLVDKVNNWAAQGASTGVIDMLNWLLV